MRVTEDIRAIHSECFHKEVQGNCKYIIRPLMGEIDETYMLWCTSASVRLI